MLLYVHISRKILFKLALTSVSVFIISRAMFWVFPEYIILTSDFYCDIKLFQFKYDAITRNFIPCYKCHFYKSKHNFVFIPSFSRYVIVIFYIVTIVLPILMFSTYLSWNMHKSWGSLRLCVNTAFTSLAGME